MSTALDELEGLLKAATGGPWIDVKMEADGFLVVRNTSTAEADKRVCIAYVGGTEPYKKITLPAKENAELIAAAVNALPKLIQIARASQAVMAQIDSEMDPRANYTDQERALFDALSSLSASRKEGDGRG